MITKLEAVNEVLEAIGEMRVNSLAFQQADGAVNHDAETALATINRELKRALAIGWWFNTDDDTVLAADVSGIVKIPDTVLSIEETDGWTETYVRRNGKLYNRTLGSYNFTSNPRCKVIWTIELEDCPRIFADYVILKSVRSMVDKVLGDRELHGYTQQDEDRARLELQIAEGEQIDGNFFDTPDMSDALDRRTDTTPHWLY